MRIVVTTVCTATVEETWTLDVPDSLDITDPDAVMDAVSGDRSTFVSVEDEVSNEHDREFRAVEKVEPDPGPRDVRLCEQQGHHVSITRHILAECTQPAEESPLDEARNRVEVVEAHIGDVRGMTDEARRTHYAVTCLSSLRQAGDLLRNNTLDAGRRHDLLTRIDALRKQLSSALLGLEDS